MAQDAVISDPNAGRGTMTANRFRINLGKDAVKLALDGEWERAAELNRAILELYPDDCEAANRLAKSLMELADYSGARTVLQDLRAKHPSNNIARKNLARLEKLESAGFSRQPASAHVTGTPPLFIEEGGKSCHTTLRVTSDATGLTDIVAGDKINLSVADDGVIAVSADGKQLGALEPRLARRLRKLISGGNQYSSAVVSLDGDALSLVIRETKQHPSLRNVVSFPQLGRHERGMNDAEPDLSVREMSDVAEYANLVGETGVEAEQEQEDALPTLATDEIDDDDGSDVEVPVLDTDDVDDAPVLEIVAPQEDEWE